MATPRKRPGAKKISKLTEPQKRTLKRAFDDLLRKTDYLKNMSASLTPEAQKQLRNQIAAIKRQIRRSSNLMSFA